MKVYRETLGNLPVSAIEEAAMILRRRGGEFFPPAPKRYQVAEELVAERARRETLVRTRQQHVQECPICSNDNGWAPVPHDDGPETYVICACRSTNSNYRRMTASSQKSQAKR